MMLPRMQTTTSRYPQWTKATTPKDHLVEFMEKSLDKFLSGSFGKNHQRPSLPYYLLEEDSLIETATKDKLHPFLTQRFSNMTETALEEQVEGSGTEEEGVIQHPIYTQHSSIEGISKVVPHIPKVPLDFQESLERQRNSPGIVSKLIASKPEVPRAPKTAKEFEYGSKPSYQQGFVSSVLDFLGIQSKQQANTPSELDRAITEWVLEHSPVTNTKARKRAKTDSAYNVIQKFITQSVMPLCNPQPVVVPYLNLKAFMGQWFQVMYSPLMSSTSCSMMSYTLLSQSHAPHEVGSVFQTLEYSSPRLGEYGHVRRALTSGYAMLTRQGQIVYRKSNSPEEFTVHVIHVSDQLDKNGQYEYAILAVNCNYPLYVIARDPLVFKQKHEQTVNLLLQQKRLINDMSRFLNIVSPVDFSYCVLPPTFFGFASN
uniref:Lipocalin domain-containing protein n=1 Tax=Ditylenchus dipsaci TaxID=166011 RepID=A0A915EIB2_9BILA